MARLVCGIDVGTGAVRAAVLRAGLRRAELATMLEVPLRLPEDGGPPEPAAIAEALGALAARLPAGIDTRVAAVPGSEATSRVLSFPRAALRQAEAAIRIDLEGQLPFEMDEALFDHLVVSAPGDDPASVLVAVARLDSVRQRLEALAKAGLDPGVLAVGAMPLTRLIPRGHPLAAEETICLVDCGRLETELLVLRRGRPVFFRSFRTGGEEVTRAIAKALRISRGEAEALKIARLALPDPVLPAPTEPQDRALAEAAQAGWAAVLTPLRRTMLELRGRTDLGTEPSRLLIVGGGSRIPGLPAFLSQRLGLPVERLGDVVTPPTGVAADAVPSFAQALSLALEPSAARSRRLDLRKGEVRYRGDAATLRAHVRNAAIAAAAVFLAWIAFAWAHGRALDAEASQQRAALERVTQNVMGRKFSDFSLVRSLLGRSRQEVDGPLPRADALDILAHLARAVPPEIRHNITLLTIEPGKLAMNGMTRNAEEAARIPKVLEEFEDCVRDVGTLSGSGSEGNYTYQIEATTSCP